MRMQFSSPSKRSYQPSLLRYTKTMRSHRQRSMVMTRSHVHRNVPKSSDTMPLKTDQALQSRVHPFD